MTNSPGDNTEFVILQGIAEGNRFFTSWNQKDKNKDLTKLNDGTVAYRVLGYAETIAEAQTFLFGRSFA